MALGVLVRSLWRLEAVWQFQDCCCLGWQRVGRLRVERLGSLRAGWKARKLPRDQ